MTGTTLGSVATYDCNRGYRMFGSHRRTCQSNRFWSGQAPECRCEPFLHAPLTNAVLHDDLFYNYNLHLNIFKTQILQGV